MLQVFLLGESKILWNGRPLPSFSSHEASSLLGFLCLHLNQSHTREALAEILSPDLPAADAKLALDETISEVVQAFLAAGVAVEDYLVMDGSGLYLRSQINFWLDVIEFESAYNSSDQLVLQSAVRVYRGPFMDGLSAEWCTKERMHLEDHYLQALRALIALTRQSVQYQKTAVLAETYLKHDPANDDIQAALLEALSSQGNLPAVKEQYQRYCEWLQTEGLPEPGLELQRLYQHLVAGWQPVMVTPPQVQQPSLALNLVQYLLPAFSNSTSGKEQSIFVGRDNHLEQMQAWWAQQPERVMCLTGAQGCGKSRLAHEFAYLLQAHGVLVGWASCATIRQAEPYAVMSDLLHSLFNQVPVDARAGIPGGLVRDFLLFFPELGSLFPARMHPSAFGVDSVNVAGAVTRLVQFMVRSFPILLVVDDFHQAPPVIQHMLEHLMRYADQPSQDSNPGLKVMLLGTPDGPELDHTAMCMMVARLARDRLVVRLELENLDRDDIRQWLFLWSGDPHRVNALAEKLYLQTGGNPYYLKETIHTLIYTGSLSTSSQGWEGPVLHGHDPQLPVPPVVRSQLENRLRRLSMLGLQVIQAAAVIGPVVPLHLLVDMIRRDGQDLERAIDELQSAGLLADFSGEESEEQIFRFPCLLYKQTIYEQTTQVRKMVLEKRMVSLAQEDGRGRRLL